MLNILSIISIVFLTFVYGIFTDTEELPSLEMNGKADLLSLAAASDQWEALFQQGFFVHYNDEAYVFIPERKDVKIENGLAHFEDPFLNFIIEGLEAAINSEPQNLVIEGAEGEGTRRLTVSAPHVDGRELMVNEMKESIQNALATGALEDDALVIVHPAEIVNQSGIELGQFNLLSTGVSNFKGSDGNRVFNIQRGLNEYMHGYLIPPGGEFSFNEALGGVSLEYADGWRAALGIFKAGELEYIPGGGICQVSTTMYRAALGAGLNIIEQRNHSLWVHYYETPSDIEGIEGNGMDATIYPGIQDLVFQNTTESNILIEAYTDGDNAVINFYGENDGRVVSFEGPYTASTYTKEVYDHFGRGLGLGEIVWKQAITWPDGNSSIDWVYSYYYSVVPQH